MQLSEGKVNKKNSIHTSACMYITLFCLLRLIYLRPMDLQQMEERLDKGQYLTFTAFRNDFKLIVNNCRLYNGQNNGNICKSLF